MPITEVEQSPSRIEVAVGVIRRGENEVLVGQRMVQDRYYRRWEFPGGKLEPRETPEQALARELSEELGIQITKTQPLIQLDHDYPDIKVRLYVMEVDSHLGEPYGREGQAIEWISLANPQVKDFLEATQPIFTALTLPKRIMITDTKRFGMDRTCEAVAAKAVHGASVIVQVREPELSLKDRMEFTAQLVKSTNGSPVQIVQNDGLDADFFDGITGIHLSALNTREALAAGLKRPLGKMLGCSCHNAGEIRVASMIDADYITLGSVAVTPSHPDGAVLGISQFSNLSELANIPVFAVGGMDESDIKQIRQAGGQGVAMISAAWGKNL
jgi:8-oxo-dGTP diphosphatase